MPPGEADRLRDPQSSVGEELEEELPLDRQRGQEQREFAAREGLRLFLLAFSFGVARDAPVGFREIRLKFDLDSDASEEQLKKLIELTERYCVVMQTIRNAPPVIVSR